MSSRRMKLPEGLKQAAKTARAAGWTIERTGSGHLKWKPPQGQFVITPASPGPRRSVENSLAGLRAAGLKTEEAGRAGN